MRSEFDKSSVPHAVWEATYDVASEAAGFFYRDPKVREAVHYAVGKRLRKLVAVAVRQLRASADVADGGTLAILPPKIHGELLALWASYVRADLESNGDLLKDFQIIERSAVVDVLQALEDQYKSLTYDPKTLAEIGKRSGAKYILVPELSLLNERELSLHARIVSVETTKVVATGRAHTIVRNGANGRR